MLATLSTCVRGLCGESDGTDGRSVSDKSSAHPEDVARSGDRKISWSSLFLWNGICTVSRFRISGLELRGFGRNYSAYYSILLLDDVDVAFRHLFWLLLRFNMKL